MVRGGELLTVDHAEPGAEDRDEGELGVDSFRGVGVAQWCLTLMRDVR